MVPVICFWREFFISLCLASGEKIYQGSGCVYRSSIKMNTISTKRKSVNIRKIVAVGVFCALAYVCTVIFHFKVAFLSFDFKDAIMTIGAMYFGPLSGLSMALIVSFLEFITISTTELYGFVMNFLSSAVFVCVGTVIYKFRHTMVGAVVGMVSSVAAMTAVMMGANLVITPFYMNCTVDEVIALIPTLLFPFNLTKAVLNAAIVFILYKPVSTALKSAGFIKSGSQESAKLRFTWKNVTVSLIALVIAGLALVFFFVVLKGTFTVG